MTWFTRQNCDKCLLNCHLPISNLFFKTSFQATETVLQKELILCSVMIY